jgi:hypothetical protein
MPTYQELRPDPDCRMAGTATQVLTMNYERKPRFKPALPHPNGSHSCRRRAGRCRRANLQAHSLPALPLPFQKLLLDKLNKTRSNSEFLAAMSC